MAPISSGPCNSDGRCDTRRDPGVRHCPFNLKLPRRRQVNLIFIFGLPSLRLRVRVRLSVTLATTGHHLGVQVEASWKPRYPPAGHWQCHALRLTSHPTRTRSHQLELEFQGRLALSRRLALPVANAPAAAGPVSRTGRGPPEGSSSSSCQCQWEPLEVNLNHDDAFLLLCGFSPF